MSETPLMTMADIVRARANDDALALKADGRTWTYREWVQCCADRAALWEAMRDPQRPPHIGVLLDNVAEFTMWLGAAALVGATVVGINPTRRGEQLAHDVRHTECQLLVTEASWLHLFDDLDTGVSTSHLLDTDHPTYAATVARHSGAAVPTVEVLPSAQFLLLFTSGTSGTPKAVICTQGRVAGVSHAMIGVASLTAADVTYVSMPLFHSNSLFTGWAPSVLAGACVALRRKFSASEFINDARRYGVTYFNYVGKPLAYVVATPPRPDDLDNPLVRGFGNEANDADLVAFAERFGCRLIDGYGQSEMGASIVRVPNMPAGSLGVAAPSVVVLDPDTGVECPRARFDEGGRLLNAEEAIGEIVNTAQSSFEGYWNNPEAEAERLRNGAYWTGDLAYRDDAGFFYFAGRTADWIRVDGENFAAAPVERVLARFPGVVLGAVYGVPDPVAGDRAMAALQLNDGIEFDPAAFAAFLAQQSELGPKWVPTFVRVAAELPLTQTNKVLKRELVTQRWECADRVWVRGTDGSYRPFGAADAAALEASFAAHGRLAVIGR
ncbi:MAG: AMP-binding protein [Actinomycetota bacterium]